MAVCRRCYACRRCRRSRVPFDEWAGRGKGHLTPGATRMVCRAATGWSFDRASEHLRELTGIDVSDQTVRRVAEAQGVKAGAWLESSALATGKVKAARGHAEVYSDGTMVNTREGWQEVRLTVFDKREAGPASDPAAFTGLGPRTLPRPAARLALASKRNAEQMGLLWRATADRLGWGRGAGLSAVADGARWIAAQMEEALPQAQRVLDVFHVSEHLHGCGAALHGENTQEARDWAVEQLVLLVRQGPGVLLWSLERQAAAPPAGAKRAAIRGLLDYLRPHEKALRYGERLRRGLPIGSGQIEGACKTIVGRRLKINSARWSPGHVEPMASLCCLDYSDLWATYWSARAA